MAHRLVKAQMKDGLSLDGVYEAFESEKTLQGVEEITLFGYRKAYEAFKRDTGLTGDESVKVLKKTMVYIWLEKMKEREISTASINHYLASLRAFAYFCQREKLIEVFDITLLKTQEVAPKAWTEEDIEKLLIEPDWDDFVEVRTWVIVNLILATGLRRGSICSLLMSSVNLEKRILTVPHTKNKKHLSIPISSALAPILSKFIEDWRYNTKEDDYLFCAVDGRRMSENAIRLAFERYAKARGAETTSLHSGRHAFATNMARLGANAYTIQTVLGHSTPTISAKYIRMSGNDIKANFNQFSLIDNKSHRGGTRKSVKRQNRQNDEE